MNKTIFGIHSWLGLITGIILSVVSLTGVSMVFREEITDVSNPSRHVTSQGSSLTYDSIRSITTTLYPKHRLAVLLASPAQGHPIISRVQTKTETIDLFIDPVTGKVLDSLNEKDDLYNKIFLLHRTLLIGETGKVIMFFFGVSLILSTLSGIYVYRKQFANFFGKLIGRKKNVKLGNTTSKRWHTAIGLVAFLTNIFFAVTGGLMQYSAVENLFAGPKKSPSKTAPSLDSLPPASLDKMIADAQKQHPDYSLHRFIFSTDNAKVTLRGKVGDATIAHRSRDTYEFDARTGEVLKFAPAYGGSFFDDLVIISHPLHMAYWAGTFGKILYVLFGLMPAVLSITGFIIALKRLRKKTTLAEELSTIQ